MLDAYEEVEPNLRQHADGFPSVTNLRQVDDDELNYRWWVYKECGSYLGDVTMTNQSNAKTVVRIPEKAKGKNFHVILTLADNGSPQLTSNRRIVVNAR